MTPTGDHDRRRTASTPLNRAGQIALRALRGLWRRILPLTFVEDRGALARRRRRVLWIVACAVIGALVLSFIAGSAAPFQTLLLLLMLFAGFLAMAWFPINERTGPHCARCKQACANPTPAICPECGVALDRPGAISETRTRGWRTLACVALWYGLISTPSLLYRATEHLPPRARIALASVGWQSGDLFGGLDPVRMSAEETRAAAELLIESARPRDSRRFDSGNFLDRAIRSGNLPAEYREKAAQAIISASLSIERSGDGITATVTPEFGDQILFPTEEVVLVFGGVSLDGETWTKGSDWAHTWQSVAMGASRRQDEMLDDLQFAHTGRIDGVPRGTHTLRARCWIVIPARFYGPFVPVFDGRGVIVPGPDTKGVYPIELERTIDVK